MINMAGYADYQALADVLAAIGAPAQGSGANSIASMIAQLNTVITNTQDTVNNLATALTKLDGVITQIQTGTPAIKNPIQIVSDGFTAIGSGVSVTEGPYTITGTSYVIDVAPVAGAGSTIPFMTVEVVQYTISHDFAQVESFDLPMGSADYQTVYTITGPLHGNSVEIVLTNNDSVAGTYFITMQSNNIQTDHSRIVAPNFGSIPGYASPPNFDASKKVMGHWYQAAVPAGSTVSTIIPPWNGTVSICLRGDLATATIAATMAALISEENFGGLATGNLFSSVADANGNMNATVALPRASCILAIKNTAAVAQGISIALIGQEF